MKSSSANRPASSKTSTGIRLPEVVRRFEPRASPRRRGKHGAEAPVHIAGHEDGQRLRWRSFAKAAQHRRDKPLGDRAVLVEEHHPCEAMLPRPHHPLVERGGDAKILGVAQQFEGEAPGRGLKRFYLASQRTVVDHDDGGRLRAQDLQVAEDLLVRMVGHYHRADFVVCHSVLRTSAAEALSLWCLIQTARPPSFCPGRAFCPGRVGPSPASPQPSPCAACLCVDGPACPGVVTAPPVSAQLYGHA